MRENLLIDAKMCNMNNIKIFRKWNFNRFDWEKIKIWKTSKNNLNENNFLGYELSKMN